MSPRSVRTRLMTRLLRRPTLDESNRVFTAVVIGWGGIVGSGVSILFSGAILAAAVRLYRRDIAFPADRDALAIGAAFALFFLSEALSGAVNYEGWPTLREVLSNLPFLGFLLIYARLSLSSRQGIVQAVEFGAVTGAFGAFAWVLVEIFVQDSPRAEGAAGNPGVLALISALLYGLCLLTATRRSDRLRWVALLAAICAAAALLLTGMRALWPMLVVAPFIPLAVLRPKIDAKALRRGVLVAALPAALAVFLTYGVVETRIGGLAADFDRIERGDYDSSIGKRLTMWDAGLDLATAKPVFGHGPAVSSDENPDRIGFSHLHNFLLNAMVRAGIVGVAAVLALFIVPLWVAARRGGDDISRFGVAMLLTLHAAFLMSGLVGIMLGHDILDALFIFGTVVASFLVLGRRTAHGRNVPSKLN